MKEFLKSFFGASNKEIKGLSLLIFVLIVILLGLKTKNLFYNKSDAYLIEDAKILDSLILVLERNKQKEIKSNAEEVFIFNPNNATQKEFLSLGFNERIARRIENYRNSGGVFRIKKDLYKIYDIDSALVDTLYAFIDLPEKIHKEKSPVVQDADSTRKPVKIREKKVTELPDFNINTADTSMLQTIRGIGSVLSKRIVDYRANIGGFVDLVQLYEIYNLDSLVTERLINKVYIENNFAPKPLNINTFTEKELAAHPYISWRQARLIIAYRNQHGNYRDEEDLAKVYSVDEKLLKKIRPYLVWTAAN